MFNKILSYLNFKNVFLFLIIGVFVGTSLKNLFRSYVIHNCHRITIAVPTKITGGMKTGEQLEYNYTIKNTKYDGTASISDLYEGVNDKDFLQRRYFVEVSCDYPSFSSLVLDRKVPDVIVTIPNEGWSSIPEK